MKTDLARAVLTEIIVWFPDCAQLLDGWHADGTAWTEWDEQIRTRLADLYRKAAAVLDVPDLETEREALARIIYESTSNPVPWDEQDKSEYPGLYDWADAILAAGYRRPSAGEPT